MNDYIKPNIRELALKHGIAYPTDEELVMLILGSGTKGMPVERLAKNVVDAINTSNTEDLNERLTAVKGLGQSKALAIRAAIEFGRRRNSFKSAVVKSPKDIIPFVKNYSMQSREHFICVTLTGGHEIIQIRIASIGTVNRTIVHPREVFSEALMENAAALIVCHNHPSGNCNPSEEDVKTTEILIQASEILGIPLLDHIIINRSSYFSFMEHGLLFSPTGEEHDFEQEFSAAFQKRRFTLPKNAAKELCAAEEDMFGAFDTEE
ncbi:MAG: RadC family protein [Treponema sp.]